nr:midasin [Ipomoea batatas]
MHDTYIVSEDSVDDGDGNEDNEQVESVVGETGQAVKDKGEERELQAQVDSAATDDEKEGADRPILGHLENNLMKMGMKKASMKRKTDV